MGKIIKTLRENIQTYADDWSTGTENLVEKVDAQVEVIQNQIRVSLDNLSADNAVLRAQASDITKTLHQIRKGIQQLGDTPQLTVEDESLSVTEGPGVISACISEGDVNGDSNVGGIVGTMSVEVQDEPETTMAVEDISLMADTTVHLRAVVRDCDFNGIVNAKNDCAGGIVGRSEAGAVSHSVAKGQINAGTEFCGGIAGKIKGDINESAALTDLTGEGWLGGIAGKSGDISNSIAMARTKSQGEFLGAIAGETEGELLENYYLMEDLAGLDGVDYAGRAQGLDFNTFSELENVPADFLEFSYRFVADGHTIVEIPFEYGADLDLSKVPESPVFGERCGFWPEYPVKDLKRSMILNASFEEPESTIAWGGNPVKILAEGSFTHDAKLEAEEIDLPDWISENETPIAAYRYMAGGCRSENVTLRLRAGNIKNPKASLLQEKQWVALPAELDGSYLILNNMPLEGEIVLLQGKTEFSWEICAAAGALLILLLVCFFGHKKKKKQQHK